MRLEAAAALGYKARMPRWLHDQRVFWRQFRQQFHTTGAILPSGRYLARALARYVGQDPGGQRVLEVGPGTGAITARIVERMGPLDHFDMVELNAEFVRRLKERFEGEEPFRSAAARSNVLHCPIEELATEHQYDLVISGLPLNNFSVDAVERLLDVMTRLLRPGGTLSFFEYIAIRPARAVVSGREERARLRGIGAALDRLLVPYEIRRDWVWPNVPPAWAHHVRMPAAGSATPSGQASPTDG
jgi:phosphatidylethanolamine/phosphatidyl-N-methylethanolamine N-methyltransferase